MVIDKLAGAETAIKAHDVALMINTALRAVGEEKKWNLLRQPNKETQAAAPRSGGNAAEHGEDEVMHYVKKTTKNATEPTMHAKAQRRRQRSIMESIINHGDRK